MVVWKFKVDNPAQGRTALQIPATAQLLAPTIQGDEMVVWALLDPMHEIVEPRWIIAVNTGQEFDQPLAGNGYLGTCTHPTSGIVWHVFEVAR